MWKMVKDFKSPMAPRQAKYILLAFVSVIAMLIIINSGLPDHFQKDDNGKEEIITYETKVKYSVADEVESTLSKVKLKGALERKIRNATIDEAATLEMLIDTNHASCFNTYEPIETQTKSGDLFDVLKAAVDKKKISYVYTLSVFNEIMSSLNIQLAVIEPSIIYCLLKPKHRELLTKRNFNLANFTAAKNVITYGIRGDDVAELEKEENINKLRSYGFQPFFIRETPAFWMTGNSTGLELKKCTNHVFYSYYGWTIHVVVFWKRNSYLWHSGLNQENEINIPKIEDMLFARHDSAYENFTFVTLDLKWPGLNFYIPSSPDYFLFQTLSSRFLECDLTRATDVKNDTASPKAHSSLSVESFNERFLISLQELKKFFNPLLMNFWIFSGTMLGWDRQCDVIPYTTDVDFGAWASEIEDLDYIIQHFRKNKILYILERMGVQEEALEFQLRSDGLRVDVFFLYKLSNGSWASGHRPSLGYYFRYHYPPFTLCSAELLHERVQVPCETENVIVTEYGPNWRTPVSSWNYESSIHNRGPDIYWDKERLPKAFEEYK